MPVKWTRIKEYSCAVCGASWLRIRREMPQRCKHCHSRRWNGESTSTCPECNKAKSVKAELCYRCRGSARRVEWGRGKGRLVLLARYGPNDGRPWPRKADWTLAEVGKKWGTSRERIRQMEARAKRYIAEGRMVSPYG
jgi:DNA-directed RNA polymerase subunit RPC12/RpoP